MKRIFRLRWSAIVLVAAAAVARAQSTSAPASRPTQPEISNTLTLHPAPATQPWTQYRLTPSILDQQPGNAVPFYLLAGSSWPDEKTTNDVLGPEKGKYDYLDTPIDQFPRQYAQRLLDAYADTLHYADIGARRRDANWDNLWDVDWSRPSTLRGPFEYLGQLRHVENLMGFRSRLEMSRRNWPAAIHSIQDQFAIARHVGTAKHLAHDLTSASFAEMAMHRGVEEWVGREGSPNLYWPLANLPRPFVVMQADGQLELAFRSWKPLISQALENALPVDRWPQALSDMVTALQDARPPGKRDAALMQSEVKRLVDSKFVTAREALRRDGVTEAALSGLSREQIVGTGLIREYREAATALWKSFNLPFPQAQEQMLRTWRAIAPQQAPASENPLIQADLVPGWPVEYKIPTVLSIRYRIENADRYIAIMQTVEALRDYAATHAGEPPARLEDVTNLPIPADPMTGRPFVYTVEGNTAMLDATPPAPFAPSGGWRFELHFTK